MTWAKEPALKDKGITLKNYKPQKGLVFVFVYFDGQFSIFNTQWSMLRSALATLLQSEATKRIFNLQCSIFNVQSSILNAQCSARCLQRFYKAKRLKEWPIFNVQ